MPYSEAQKRAVYKYREKKLKRITLDLPVEEYEVLEQYCSANNEPRATFIRRAIKETIARDEEKP